MEIFDRLERHWNKAKIHPRYKELSPASGQDVAAFEQKNGVTLPADFKEYIRRFNGIEEDPDFFCLWPISRLRPVDLKRFNLLQGDSYFYFADWGIECNYYAIYLGNSPVFQNQVTSLDYPGSPVIANTFTEFLELYLRDDPKLFGH